MKIICPFGMGSKSRTPLEDLVMIRETDFPWDILVRLRCNHVLMMGGMQNRWNIEFINDSQPPLQN